jgi:plastocyanin
MLGRVVLLCALVALLGATPAAAAQRTHTFRAGPYTMADFGTRFIRETVRAPEVDGYVTWMRARLVNSQGVPVTIRAGMLHHVFFRNLSVNRIRGHCSARQPEVFYSTGEEDEDLDLPAGYGYRVRPAHRWQMSGMLMSHAVKPKHVWVEYRVRTDTAPRTAVRPMWVRANGCGPASSYNVPGDGGPGSVHDRVEHWTVPVSGRIVAAGGHLHGGARNLTMTQPACGNRQIYENTPYFGPPDHPVYTAEPFLHEAGPVNTSWFSTPTGVPVRKGEVLDVHGVYDNQHARGAVMAITHVYLAPDERVPGGCGPLPADAAQSPQPPGTRRAAPYQRIPLWKLDAFGRPVELAEPESPAIEVPDGFLIALRRNRYAPENVLIRAGESINWRFDDRERHNLTFASGPRVVAGQTMSRGERAQTRFDVPGRYQLFCYLHPMTMREQITVLPR